MKIFETLRLAITLVLLSLPITSLATEKLPVVTSFSILADMSRQIGGERIEVHSLVGENGDAHVYQPTPSDSKILGRARLVVINGLGFEGWIERLIKPSGFRGSVVVASTNIKTLNRIHSGTHDHRDNHREADPHAWLDAKNSLIYADNIVTALIQADPEGRAYYEANAARYKREINEVDQQIRAMSEKIPAERRRVVTSHDAFGYFGRAYGIAFIAAVGMNSGAEPSASTVARIIRQIKQEKIPAIFVENFTDSRLQERIQRETGAKIGGVLYPDALSGQTGPAVTYLDLMRHNARVLSASLQK